MTATVILKLLARGSHSKVGVVFLDYAKVLNQGNLRGGKAKPASSIFWWSSSYSMALLQTPKQPWMDKGVGALPKAAVQRIFVVAG